MKAQYRHRIRRPSLELKRNPQNTVSLCWNSCSRYHVTSSEVPEYSKGTLMRHLLIFGGVCTASSFTFLKMWLMQRSHKSFSKISNSSPENESTKHIFESINLDLFRVKYLNKSMRWCFIFRHQAKTSFTSAETFTSTSTIFVLEVEGYQIIKAWV